MSVGFPAKVWREAKKDYQTLGQEGQLLYWTTVKAAGEGFEKMAPYQVALVRLNKKQVVGGQLVDCQGKNLKKGMKVVSVARRVRANGPEEPIKYGVKWRLK